MMSPQVDLGASQRMNLVDRAKCAESFRCDSASVCANATVVHGRRRAPPCESKSSLCNEAAHCKKSPLNTQAYASLRLDRSGVTHTSSSKILLDQFGCTRANYALVSTPPPHPTPFLEIRVHQLEPLPGLVALCAGYEQSEWREKQLVKHLVRWLPEFALKYSEWENLRHYNAIELAGEAARSIYASNKFESRGEFGELLLHVALRQCFETVPAVSKYFYKDARNDTVKGFDAVHVVASADDLELWLGEVKFYKSISKAIADVVEELQQHTGREYLRDEFAAIANKIDPQWPHAERLAKLLHPNTSLDEVFDRVCIPVLLTYDSPVIKKHGKVCDAYKAAFDREIRKHHASFAKKPLPDVKIHLILFPLLSKTALAAGLDHQLKIVQEL